MWPGSRWEKIPMLTTSKRGQVVVWLQSWSREKSKVCVDSVTAYPLNSAEAHWTLSSHLVFMHSFTLECRVRCVWHLRFQKNLNPRWNYDFDVEVMLIPSWKLVMLITLIWQEHGSRAGIGSGPVFVYFCYCSLAHLVEMTQLTFPVHHMDMSQW